MTTQHRARTRVEEFDDSAARGALEQARRWLFKSGIYVLNRDDPNYGAVFSEYNPKSARHELVYAEATGYVLSILKYLASNGIRPSLDYARASGDWLVRWSHAHDGIIALGEQDGRVRREAYAFDNGVCCKGLLDLYELTGDAQYLRCAERIAEWLMNHAVNSDGSVKPILDLDSGIFAENPAVWYGVSGSFHAKIAMALLQLHSTNNQQGARESALRIYRWAIGQQKPDGSFPANGGSRFVFMHPHCYTVEALLYAYGLERDPKFIDAAERAIEWMIRVQSAAGHVPRWYGRGWFRGKASDAQAQAVRLFCLFNMLKTRPAVELALHKAVASLVGMQLRSDERQQRGGFYEGEMRRYRLLPGKSVLMTSWSAMFAIHALSLECQIGGDFFREAKYLF